MEMNNLYDQIEAYVRKFGLQPGQVTALTGLLMADIVGPAIRAERERCAKVADGFIDTKRTFDDDGAVNYHAGFIDGALAVREAIRALD